MNQYRTIYRCSFDWLLNCLYAWPGWSWQGCGNYRSVATAAAPQGSTKRSTDALFVEQVGTLYLWWLGTGWKKRPTRLNPDSSFTQVQPRQRFRHLSLQSCPHGTIGTQSSLESKQGPVSVTTQESTCSLPVKSSMLLNGKTKTLSRAKGDCPSKIKP